MLLQSVRPNIVQAIRAYRDDDLMRAAQESGQHFLFANLTDAQSKQDVLETIATSFLFPQHFGKNLDALYDCMTDSVHKAGPQRGFVVVVEQIPDSSRFIPSDSASYAACRLANKVSPPTGGMMRPSSTEPSEGTSRWVVSECHSQPNTSLSLGCLSMMRSSGNLPGT